MGRYKAEGEPDARVSISVRRNVAVGKSPSRWSGSLRLQVARTDSHARDLSLEWHVPGMSRHRDIETHPQEVLGVRVWWWVLALSTPLP